MNEPQSMVLVAIDFSEASHQALSWALDNAVGPHTALHLVHVIDDHVGDLRVLLGLERERERVDAEIAHISEAAKAALARLSDAERSEVGTVTHHVRRGRAASEIAACARNLDATLLVVGSHGHTGLERALLGSVAERVTRLADCPVVVIKQRS